jgi:glycosyltransferase involved in cell wall biosynthesis
VVDVGVVMPVYYQKMEYLQESIQSVLEQLYRSYKFVIVIDGAPEMLGPVKEYTAGDPRVKIISYETNLGVAGALNTGFKELLFDTKIRYLTWVSSDNVYDVDFLGTLRKALRLAPEDTGLVYSSFRSIDGDGKTLKSEADLALLRQFQSQPIEGILDSSMIGVSFMYKREYALQAGEYRYPPVEDYDFWLRLTETCGARYVPLELMDCRVDSEYSVSSRLQAEEMHRKWRYMYHLSRLEARIRRGIPLETSVLFLVNGSQDDYISHIDELYEQVYSNYQVYILDLTPDSSATKEIAKIQHPSIIFKWFPLCPEQEVLYYTAQFLYTPFTFLYGKEGFQNHVELHYLAAELKKSPEDIFSVYQSGDRSQVMHRFDIYSEEPLGSELFRTHKLVQWLVSRHPDFPGGPGK